MPIAEPVSVVIVDDHPLVREGLASLIGQQAGFCVCGEAENFEGGLRLIAAKRPHIAIVDISLKDVSGLELIKLVHAKHPEVRIIAFSMHDERLYAERAIRAGARGYVMKRESSGKIIDAIKRVLDGKLAISEEMASALAHRVLTQSAGTTTSEIEQLSDRELEVFQLLGRGYETRRVAETLNVSIKTIQTYCVRIKQKLGLTSASELVFEAVRRGGCVRDGDEPL